jgi:N-acetylglucosamine kinase-like BadF-type ATPase
MPRYFLGVDGGQSSTKALISDESGAVIGAGRGGPCNHVKGPEGREKFSHAIGECLDAARAAAGLAADVEFEAVCLGFSGGPADKEGLLKEMVRARRRVITDDALIALSGATAGAPGVITIAGTGSISFGRNATGKTARVGGWGYVYGDEGGGFDITRQALRAALRMEEGWGPGTALRAKLLDATGAHSANELLHKFYTVDFPRPRVASFAKLVGDAAVSGDAVADDILKTTAQHLADITSAARQLLFAPEDPCSVAYVGGVFRNRGVLARFRMLVEASGHSKVSPPKYGPAAGALLEAYHAAGLAVTLHGGSHLEK